VVAGTVFRAFHHPLPFVGMYDAPALPQMMQATTSLSVLCRFYIPEECGHVGKVCGDRYPSRQRGEYLASPRLVSDAWVE
jgi:hypothetical protein